VTPVSIRGGATERATRGAVTIIKVHFVSFLRWGPFMSVRSLYRENEELKTEDGTQREKKSEKVMYGSKN
jgi:hypothetical protein